MRVVIDVPEHWREALPRLAEEMGCDPDEAFGRGIAVTHAIVAHLREPGATVVLRSPTVGDSELWTGPLFGRPGTAPNSVLQTGS